MIFRRGFINFLRENEAKSSYEFDFSESLCVIITENREKFPLSMTQTSERFEVKSIPLDSTHRRSEKCVRKERATQSIARLD